MMHSFEVRTGSASSADGRSHCVESLLRNLVPCSESREVVAHGVRQPTPLQTIKLPSGVIVRVFQEGDGIRKPEHDVKVHLVGRLSNGCIFESTRGKGQPHLHLQLGKRAIVPGMELGLRELPLGSIAEVEIPSALGYAEVGVPRMIPPHTDLIFEVQVIEVDGVCCTKFTDLEVDEADIGRHQMKEVSSASMHLCHPWWLARVSRPLPTGYYLSFCRFLKGNIPSLLMRARCVSKQRCSDLRGLDISNVSEPFIMTGMQNGWKAKEQWNFTWFMEKLGKQRQLVKWQGPIFTRQECLWESPVWETSLTEYLNYVVSVDEADPACEERNAEACPRLYLNGWSAFVQVPWLREYLVPQVKGQLCRGSDSTNGSLEDISAELLGESEQLRESLLEGLTARGSYEAPPDVERKQKLADEDWELTKLFISPRGALTRLHFDNGGAHGWLSQLRGRKLFICFSPSDGKHLHPFEGDEGLLNGSWLDPLDSQAEEKWPDCIDATPYVALVEESETIVVPQGWWHYAVSLDSSVTIQRNFFSSGNHQELTKRKDAGLAKAVASHVLKTQTKLRNQPDHVLNKIANKTIEKLREAFVANRTFCTKSSSRG